ncbi:hypothetical protein Are01nite_23850 [Actinoplanes regularis]|nr:hypothetical protein Are01nite_23850 [Actinoplanes regularis]
MADTGRAHADPDLARARPEHGHIVANVEFLAEIVEYCGPHLATSSEIRTRSKLVAESVPKQAIGRE